MSWYIPIGVKKKVLKLLSSINLIFILVCIRYVWRMENSNISKSKGLRKSLL